MDIYNIKDKLDDLDVLFLQIDKICQESDHPYSILQELEQKKKLIINDTIKGLIGFDSGLPVAIAWLDLPHEYYGNIILYTTDKAYDFELVVAFIQTSLLTNCVVELIQFKPGFTFRDAFIECGYLEKERQRMKYTGKKPQIKLPMGINLVPLSMENINKQAHISYEAHRTRQNIERYKEYSSLEYREEMAKKLRSGLYGKSIEPASFLIEKDNASIGLVDAIELTCWGIPNVAWLMDVVVHPEYQGMGYARVMLEYAICHAIQSGHETIGLGVTLSNKPAVALYESLGFELAEHFVEILPPYLQ